MYPLRHVSLKYLFASKIILLVSVAIENPYMFPASHGGKAVVIDIRATDHFLPKKWCE